MSNKEIRKQTWKYFWEQKAKEVGIFLLWVVGMIVIPVLSNKAGFTELIMSAIDGDSTGCSWFDGLLVIAIVLLMLVLIGLVGYFIYSLFEGWIKSNWERAESRAEEKFEECECGHHTNDHSYLPNQISNADLACDKCNCTDFKSKTKSEDKENDK